MNIPAVAIIISSPHTCRICYEPCEQMSGCKCVGPMQYVHKECLETWKKISKRDTCELCNEPWSDDYQKCVDCVMYKLLNLMVLLFIAMIVLVFIHAVGQ